MADMYPAFDYGNLIKEELKRKEKIGGYDINESAISDFADPNYEPISILDQFADPDYVSESIQDKIAKEVPMEQQLSISELMLNAKAKDSKQLRESKALSKYAADLNKKDKAAKAKAEKEKFVPRDTLLGRIFDKRVRPGEEISNRDKSSAILRNISDNLMERRLVGGKKGTDTLSRILGPSGGIRGGFEEIEALETASKSKKAAAVDKALERKKKAYEIQKISSESMKNIAELAKTDFTKATQEAMELAEFEGFEPGTLPFDDQVAAILRGAVTEGQANVYTKLMQLQKSLSILPKGSPEYIAMENDIAEMKQRVGGTTLDNSYAPEQVTDQYGNPIT